MRQIDAMIKALYFFTGLSVVLAIALIGVILFG